MLTSPTAGDTWTELHSTDNWKDMVTTKIEVQQQLIILGYEETCSRIEVQLQLIILGYEETCSQTKEVKRVHRLKNPCLWRKVFTDKGGVDMMEDRSSNHALKCLHWQGTEYQGTRIVKYCVTAFSLFTFRTIIIIIIT